jgi:hypothetical protein
MDPGVAALTGAGVSGVVALAAQVLGGTLAARASRRDRLSARLTDYLSSTHGLVLALGQMARADFSEKAKVEAERVWAYNDTANAALAEIELHDPQAIVEAVNKLDQALVQLTNAARDRVSSRAEWRARRAELVDAAVAEVKRVGRIHVRG